MNIKETHYYKYYSNLIFGRKKFENVKDKQ